MATTSCQSLWIKDPTRSLYVRPRIPVFSVILDFPSAEHFSVALNDLRAFHTGDKISMTDAAIINGILTGSIQVEPVFSVRLPESTQVVIYREFLDALANLRQSLMPLIEQRQFVPVAIGAEIDVSSESILIYLDDIENPAFGSA